MPVTGFDLLAGLAGALGGAVASVTGFGIGSLLTPTLGLAVGTKTAVAATSVPHVVGTALRFWLLRGRVDRRVLLAFGLASAAGGLTGALLHDRLTSPWLSVLFGLLLLFASASEWTGLARRLCFHGAVAWLAGLASGLLGGLVGNQGGIRSAALLGAGLSRETFVATATAVGLIVDAVRMPVYLMTTRQEVRAIWPMVVVATIGVVVGTVAGHTLLVRLPEVLFRRVVAVVLAILGAAMVRAGAGG
jgi:uncharacterized membrane protein YfcA